MCPKKNLSVSWQSTNTVMFRYLGYQSEFPRCGIKKKTKSEILGLLGQSCGPTDPHRHLWSYAVKWPNVHLKVNHDNICIKMFLQVFGNTTSCVEKQQFKSFVAPEEADCNLCCIVGNVGTTF